MSKLTDAVLELYELEQKVEPIRREAFEAGWKSYGRDLTGMEEAYLKWRNDNTATSFSEIAAFIEKNM